MNTKITDIELAIIQQEKENQAKLGALQRELHEARKAVAPTEAEKATVRKEAKLAKYKTKNGLTIHNLRLAGNEVKVTHIRYTDVDVTYGQAARANFTATLPIPSYLRGNVPFNSKGGATYIAIKTRKNKKLLVYSACHEADAFDYKLGVKLALEQFDDVQAKSLLKVTAKMKAEKEKVKTEGETPAVTEEVAEQSTEENLHVTV